MNSGRWTNKSKAEGRPRNDATEVEVAKKAQTQILDPRNFFSAFFGSLKNFEAIQINAFGTPSN